MAMSTREPDSTSIVSTISSSRVHALSARIMEIENICVCWLVKWHNGESSDHIKSISCLQQIVNSVQIFRNADELVDFASEIKGQKLFAIVPVDFAQCIFLPLHHLPQIDSIYILCHEKIEQEQWMLQYRKFKGVYTTIEGICEHLKHHASQMEHSLASISIFDPNTLEAKDKIHLNNIDSSFMYSQLIKDMILETPYDESETALLGNFTEFCRTRYAANAVTLQIIEKFHREYYLHTPVWWYTRSVDIYYIFNQHFKMYVSI